MNAGARRVAKVEMVCPSVLLLLVVTWLLYCCYVSYSKCLCHWLYLHLKVQTSPVNPMLLPLMEGTAALNGAAHLMTLHEHFSNQITRVVCTAAMSGTAIVALYRHLSKDTRRLTKRHMSCAYKGIMHLHRHCVKAYSACIYTGI